MVIVVVGPTGVGKTKMSIELAKALNGEVINADSTQVYKGLDIATAKVTDVEKEQVVHHLFDIKNVEEDYTVYNYQKDCRSKIEEIIKKKKMPILVGGTGLYIKAALYDYQFIDSNIKNNYEEIDTNILFEKLKKIDENTEIHQNNRKRIVRALNYYEETGNIPSEKKKTDTLLYPCIFIGLTLDRNILYDRIDNRVDSMLKKGLLEEAREIYESKIRTKAILTPIGYKELFLYFDGIISLEEAIETIKKNSRRYAKKQYTWFNHQIPVNWFTVDIKNFENTVSEVLTFLNEKID